MADNNKAKTKATDEPTEELEVKLDVTVPGGCYIIGDRVQDANGKDLGSVKEVGKIKAKVAKEAPVVEGE